MDVPISFSDLTYTEHGLASITFPLGVSYIASNALKNIENLDVEIFKYPKDFSDYLTKKVPKVACFSNYSWNSNLSYEFAKRVKENFPKTVIVFGGPNFPITETQQRDFLISRPFIDFYISGEGEQSFVDFYNTLSKNDFNVDAIKKAGLSLSSCHYVKDGKIIKGNLTQRLSDLDEIPSPYLSGLMDKFFDGVLTPMIQTTRGCPFSCTYCQEGQPYFSKITRFSPQRIQEEFDYIAQRAKVPNLIIVDSNFGMYKEDLETAKLMASSRRKFQYPKHIGVATGKNKKGRTLDVVRELGGI